MFVLRYFFRIKKFKIRNYIQLDLFYTAQQKMKITNYMNFDLLSTDQQ